MRRIGIGLIMIGLAAAIFAVLLQETGGANQVDLLDTLFFAGVAACALGVLMFTVRVMIARRSTAGSTRRRSDR